MLLLITTIFWDAPQKSLIPSRLVHKILENIFYDVLHKLYVAKPRRR